jgi:hypothetical protein
MYPDLDASHVVPAGARGRLERLCRYVLRPPVMSERLRLCADGKCSGGCLGRWRDGTTHVRFDPCDFLGRLAMLVSRPRVNLLFYHGYHGVLGARSAWRRAIVPGTVPRGAEAPAAAHEPPPAVSTYWPITDVR